MTNPVIPVLALWAAAAAASPVGMSVSGTALMADGTACSDCRVMVKDAKTNEIITAKTGPAGQFRLRGLSAGRQFVILIDQNGRTVARPAWAPSVTPSTAWVEVREGYNVVGLVLYAAPPPEDEDVTATEAGDTVATAWPPGPGQPCPATCGLPNLSTAPDPRIKFRRNSTSLGGDNPCSKKYPTSMGCTDPGAVQALPACTPAGTVSVPDVFIRTTIAIWPENELTHDEEPVKYQLCHQWLAALVLDKDAPMPAGLAPLLPKYSPVPVTRVGCAEMREFCYLTFQTSCGTVVHECEHRRLFERDALPLATTYLAKVDAAIRVVGPDCCKTDCCAGPLHAHLAKWHAEFTQAVDAIPDREAEARAVGCAFEREMYGRGCDAR